MVRQDFRKRVWCPILIFITYFLGLEVRLLMTMDKYLKAAGRHSHGEYYYDGFRDAATFVRESFFGRGAAEISAFEDTA